jgi:hypothetical protein
MMTMAIGRRSRKSRVDDERTEHANHAHHVAEHLALVPLGRGLVARLREPIVERTREELFAAIQSPRLQQLLGANHSKRIEQFRADDVLPAFTAIERQIPDACVIASCRSRQKRRILIVGMRSRVQDARRRLQPLECLRQTGGAEVVDWPHLRIDGCANDAVKEQHGSNSGESSHED